MKFNPREIRREAYRRALYLLPYEHRQRIDYSRRYHRHPDILTPTRHSEHMLRRVLYAKDDILTTLSDKDAMKRLAADVTADMAMNITPTRWTGAANELPNVVPKLSAFPPWALKPRHLGGGIVTFGDSDTTPAEWKLKTGDLIRTAGQKDYEYRRLAPVAWRQARSGFILEDRIGDPSSRLTDYKLHVFNGTVRLISVYANRDTRDLTVQHFDLELNYIFGRHDKGHDLRPPATVVDQLARLAQPLGLGLPYTRVDFYWHDNTPWFGEISPFGSMDGLGQQPALDIAMGGWWEAP